MKIATLLFPVKKTNGTITDICLAMKKRGFGEGRWNGAGGKVQAGESIEEALVRETKEEIGISIATYEKVAEFDFLFPHNPDFDTTVHAYLSTLWDGEPKESEEMAPKWFTILDIPYNDMWSDDEIWLPRILLGERLKGSFIFSQSDEVMSHHLSTVSSF
jgi:mutator protein MutT